VEIHENQGAKFSSETPNRDPVFARPSLTAVSHRALRSPDFAGEQGLQLTNHKLRRAGCPRSRIRPSGGWSTGVVKYWSSGASPNTTLRGWSCSLALLGRAPAQEKPGSLLTSTLSSNQISTFGWLSSAGWTSITPSVSQQLLSSPSDCFERIKR
jgi:hypothetical protein